MADPLNPIDVEQSLAAFVAAYPEVFDTLKINPDWIGPKTLAQIISERRDTAEYANRIENFLQQIVDKYTAIKGTASTTTADPATLITVGTVPDGGVLHATARVWGKKAARDFVYVDMECRAERDGGVTSLYIDKLIPPIYSPGGTLTTATVAWRANGSVIEVRITPEATPMTWEGYAHKREVFVP